MFNRNKKLEDIILPITLLYSLKLVTLIHLPCPELTYTHISGDTLNPVIKLVLSLYQYISDQVHQKYIQLCLKALYSDEPFPSYKQFNFYTIKLHCVNDSICFKQLHNYIHHTLKYNPILAGELNQLGWKTYKIVILSQGKFFFYASMSAPEKSSVIFLGMTGLENSYERLRQIFLYELGHAFGFRDEYYPLSFQAESSTFTTGPNCAMDIETAKKCWGDLLHKGAGYYKGCAGNEDYIKPTRNSLMSFWFSPGNTYGPVSESYMIKEII